MAIFYGGFFGFLTIFSISFPLFFILFAAGSIAFSIISHYTKKDYIQDSTIEITKSQIKINKNNKTSTYRIDHVKEFSGFYRTRGAYSSANPVASFAYNMASHATNYKNKKFDTIYLIFSNHKKIQFNIYDKRAIVFMDDLKRKIKSKGLKIVEKPSRNWPYKKYLVEK